MNRAAVLAELPSDAARDWFARHASDPTWRSLATDVAVDVGRVLLANGGAAGWDPATRNALLDHASPAVKAIAARLPFGSNRRWYAVDAARLLAEHFGLRNVNGLRLAIRVTD